MSLQFNKKAYMTVVIIYVIIGIVAGTYVSLKNLPSLTGFVFDNWSNTYYLKYVNILNKTPIIVITNSQRTAIYEKGEWFEFNFASEGACFENNYLAFAIDFKGRPALVTFRNERNANLYIFDYEGVPSTISCSGDTIIIGGIFPRPFLISFHSNLSKATLYVLPQLFPAVKMKLADLKEGFASLIELSNGTKYLFVSEEGRHYFLVFNNSVEISNVVNDNNMLILTGGIRQKDESIEGLILFLNSSKAIVLRISGAKGVKVLSARYNKGFLRLYLRPISSFWDALAEVRDSKVWFSRLFWPYNHVVSIAKLDQEGNSLTATILYKENETLLVITKGFTLRPAMLWNEEPLFYIKKPVIGQKISASTLYFREVKANIHYIESKVDFTERNIIFRSTQGMPKPRSLSLKVNKGAVFAINALFGIVIGALVYEAFRPYEVNGDKR